MKLLSRYADWTRRRGGTLQCSPALMVLAAIVVFGAVCYVYRQVIITTIETALFAAGATVAFGAVVVVTVSTWRWYLKRQKAMAAEPSGAVALATATDDEETTAISREADWLADAGSELVFDKDGNLRAKTAKKS